MAAKTTAKPKKRCVTTGCNGQKTAARILAAREGLKAASLKAIRAGADPGSEEYEKAMRPARDELEDAQTFVKRALAVYAAKEAAGKLDAKCFGHAVHLASTLVKRPAWVLDRLRAEEAAKGE